MRIIGMRMPPTGPATNLTVTRTCTSRWRMPTRIIPTCITAMSIDPEQLLRRTTVPRIIPERPWRD
jgi:hypothetical protein